MKKPLVFLWASIFLAHLPVAFGGGLLLNSLLFWWVFPLFAMYVHLGYSRTRCLASYVYRLAFCGLLSQVPWMLYFERVWYQPNPVLMLLGALFVYHAANESRWGRSPWDAFRVMRSGQLWKWEYALYPGHLVLLLALKWLIVGQ